MANIPGATNVLPGVITDVFTQSRGVAVPGGSRLAAMIGEGSTDETVVSQAVGGGQDGLDATYTTTTGADGRHFQLQNVALVSNRTTLFKNGIPLVGLEALIDALPFSNSYDYRIDIATGRIELQAAHILDQGGQTSVPLTTNVGDGYISALTLVDSNSPPETWTIRCVSVQRDPSNNPVLTTAKFLAFGSVSGAKLDVNGNPVVWVANGQVVSNGVLQFSVGNEVVSFREGDAFTIKVASGVLVRSDSLSVNYIPTTFLNDPVLVAGMDDMSKRHGFASLSNNLSLGGQLAFANSAPALITVQAAPPMPRRTSYVLSAAINTLSTNDDDFIFPLPLGVTPDFNSNIHFFVKNNATNVEKQILPNKFTYYLLGTAGQPTTHQFIVDNTAAPAGNSYSYTVQKSYLEIWNGSDGYMENTAPFDYKGLFSSTSVVFDDTYKNKTLVVIGVSTSKYYYITEVTNGKLYVESLTGIPSPTPIVDLADVIVDASGLRFEVIDTSASGTSNYVVINKNVVPNGYGLRISIVNSKDASFFDAGWINALESLEKVECDILVPLPKQTISVIFQNTLAHCKTMSNIRNKKERVMFAGAISGLTPDNLTGAKPAAVEDIGILEGIQGETITDILAGNIEDLSNYSVADAFGNTFRCVYFYPDQIVVQAGSDNVLIDGFYQAAAAAGYESADVRLENPLTNKVLTGYTILRNKLFSTKTLESLASAGVTTLQPVAGGGRVVWGITTSQSGFPEEQEISIVFIRDRVAKTLRAGFAGFIGNPESEDTGAILNTRAVILLNSLVSQGLITQYKDLAVKRDDVDPRQWNIAVRVQPNYPVNFIYIRVGLGQL
jgi:hypothetical protein